MGTPCSCDECVSDPSLTCSYTGEDITAEDHYIANAYKGNLILSPGGGGTSGKIGKLLHNISPPQHYTHMGIMVNHMYLIRHSTAIVDRISADEYYDGAILGVAAPTNGINPDHLEFAWPGSITQSFEQAFLAERYGESLTPRVILVRTAGRISSIKRAAKAPHIVSLNSRSTTSTMEAARIPRWS